ncbi:spermidine synthase [Sciscionella marina]|uniref:spermidine synthase n=1 Tax=Sciscionella marina TaxID=508770 RepID=UPI00037F4D9E|nr:fused MFS/spermidine synthase [Sciscionella marina]
MIDHPAVPEAVRAPVRFGTAELSPDETAAHRWRILVDGVLQSYVDLADPGNLILPYTNWMASTIEEHWAGERPLAAVHIGGGGCSLARYLARTRPGSAQTVFELDEPLTGLIREHLGLDDVPGVRVEAIDGRAGIERLPGRSMDLVVLDAFRAGAPDTGMATVEFLERIARVLRPGGLYLANVWGAGQLDFLLGAAAGMDVVFSRMAALSEAGVFMRVRPGNVVLAGVQAPPPDRELGGWAAGTGGEVFCLDPATLAAACGTAAPLTGSGDGYPEPPPVRPWPRLDT